MAQSIRGATIDFHARPFRTVLGGVVSLAIATAGAGLFLLNLGELNGGFFFGVLAAWCGSYLFWINYRAAAIRGPSLSIGADGIHVPAYANRLIPWDDITALSVYEFAHAVQIGLGLKDIAKYRPPRNWYDRFNIALGFGSPALPIEHYDQPTDSLMRAFERFAPRRLLPIVLPKPDHWIFRWSRNIFMGISGVFLLVILLADGPGLLGKAIADGYRDGDLLPQDDVRAAQWYRWLAERPGLSPGKAQRQLGEMYLEGHGVPRDEVEAFQWLTRSSADGNRRARDLRAAVAAKLGDADFQEANRLAQIGLLHDFPEKPGSLFAQFLRAEGVKAAVSVDFDSGSIGAAWGRDTLDEALNDAMQRCNALENAANRCRLFAIGDVVVAGLPPTLVARVMSDYRESMTGGHASRVRY